MIHMLTCFNLRPGATLADFGAALDAFASDMKGRGLVESVGPIGRRQRDTILDTDDARDHEFFVTMSFTDRAQSDAAVARIMEKQPATDRLHFNVYDLAADMIFICWQDVGAEPARV